MKLNIENAQPINGRILLEVIPEEDEYKGQLEIVAQTKHPSNFGIVKRTYKEYDGKVSFLKEGDVVIYPSHSGTRYYGGSRYDKQEDRKEYRLVLESDLIGVLEQ